MALTSQKRAVTKAVFFDKDGTLVENLPYNVDPARLRLTSGAGVGLSLLQEAGYRLFVVSNQPGVALGHFKAAALEPVWQRLAELLAPWRVNLAACYSCPHDIDGHVAPYARSCDCRKPQPGLLLRAAQEHGIDLARSWMVGDILHDVEAGRRAGCRAVLLDNGNETEWHMSAMRRPDLMVPDLFAAALSICARDRRQA